MKSSDASQETKNLARDKSLKKKRISSSWDENNYCFLSSQGSSVRSCEERHLMRRMISKPKGMSGAPQMNNSARGTTAAQPAPTVCPQNVINNTGVSSSAFTPTSPGSPSFRLRVGLIMTSERFPSFWDLPSLCTDKCHRLMKMSGCSMRKQTLLLWHKQNETTKGDSVMHTVTNVHTALF